MDDKSGYKTESDSSSPKAIASEPTSSSKATSAEKSSSKATASKPTPSEAIASKPKSPKATSPHTTSSKAIALEPTSSKTIASEPTSSKAIASEPTSSEATSPKLSASEGSDASEVLIMTCTCGKTKQHIPCTNVAQAVFPPIWTCEECLKSQRNDEDSIEQIVSPTKSDSSVHNPPSDKSDFTNPSAASTEPMDISPVKKQKLQDSE